MISDATEFQFLGRLSRDTSTRLSSLVTRADVDHPSRSSLMHLSAQNAQHPGEFEPSGRDSARPRKMRYEGVAMNQRNSIRVPGKWFPLTHSYLILGLIVTA